MHRYMFLVETAAPVRARNVGRANMATHANKRNNSVRKAYDKSEPQKKGKDKTNSKVKYVANTVGKMEKENISPKVVDVMEKLLYDYNRRG